jgi:hypothetical protein
LRNKNRYISWHYHTIYLEVTRSYWWVDPTTISYSFHLLFDKAFGTAGACWRIIRRTVGPVSFKLSLVAEVTKTMGWLIGKAIVVDYMLELLATRI